MIDYPDEPYSPVDPGLPMRTEWQAKLSELSAHLTIDQIAEHAQCSPRYLAYLKAGRPSDPRTSIGDAIRRLHQQYCTPVHSAQP